MWYWRWRSNQRTNAVGVPPVVAVIEVLLAVLEVSEVDYHSRYESESKPHTS